MQINQILKGTNYKLTQFKREYIKELEKSIFFSNSKKKQVAYINCSIRKKDIQLTPKEIIRQLYLKKLTKEYGYPIEQILVEESLAVGSSKKFVDIVIKDKNNKSYIFIFIDIKKSKDAKEQLSNYFKYIKDTKHTETMIWTNGEETICYSFKEYNNFTLISNFPKKNKFLMLLDIFKKILIWLWNEDTSLYIIIVVVLVFTGAILKIEIQTLKYIIISLLFIAVMVDLVKITFKYKTKIFGILLLFLFSILGYFVSIQAEYIAHDMIIVTTGEKADYFTTVNSFFQVIYFPMALIIIIIKNFIYFIPIIGLTIILPFSIIISPKKWQNKLIHISSFIFSIVILFYLVLASNIDKRYEDFFGKNYIPKKIVEYSYHKNITCIDIDTYMNFLYKDMISVTNVRDLNYTNGLSMIFVSPNDTNITFSTQKCIRKKQVSIIK